MWRNLVLIRHGSPRKWLLPIIVVLSMGVGLWSLVGRSAAVGWALAQQTGLEFNPITVIREPFAPISNAFHVTADRSITTEAELVLGVVIGDHARAYPINMLTGPSREIINDELGGRSIAATW